MMDENLLDTVELHTARMSSVLKLLELADRAAGEEIDLIEVYPLLHEALKTSLDQINRKIFDGRQRLART